MLAYHLSTRPDTVPAYQLRLYPITLERSAVLASLVMQERHALDCVQTAYEEERERVEDEWKRGRERIKERLLEGIEERRRRAREEKDGEGTGAGEFRITLVLAATRATLTRITQTPHLILSRGHISHESFAINLAAEHLLLPHPSQARHLLQVASPPYHPVPSPRARS